MRRIGKNGYVFFPVFSPGLDVREEKDAECAAGDTLVNYACVHKYVNMYR